MSSIAGPTGTLSASKHQLLQQLLSRKEGTINSIPQAPADQPIPLSFSQQRLWFMDKYLEDKSVYNIPLFMRLHGQLNQEALSLAIMYTLRKHEILNAYITEQGERAILSTHDPVDWKLETISYNSTMDATPEDFVERMADRWLKHEFTMSTGPLFHTVLLELPNTEWVWLTCVHHIIFDGWSQQLWINDLTAYYNALVWEQPLPTESLNQVRYADYAFWQHQQMQSGQWDYQLSYWLKQLSGTLPVLELPTDYVPPVLQTFNGRQHLSRLPVEQSCRIKTYCLQEGITLHMFFLSAYKVLLSIYSAEQDMLVGIPVAGRHRKEVEHMVGMFVNTLVIRSLASPEQSFSDYTQHVKQLCLDAYEHQDIPFEKLVEQLAPERSMSSSPIFRTLFSMQNYTSDDQVHLHGLETQWLDVDNHTAKYDLSLLMNEQDDQFVMEWQYNTDLFHEHTIARMSHHLEQLLNVVLDQPDIHLGAIDILTAEESELYASINRHSSDVPTDSVQHLFRQQAQLHADLPAVRENDIILTYAELDRRSDQVAAQLLQTGVQPQQRVVVCLTRSASFVVTVLAVLKVGAVYVPLDPALPDSRLAYILDDIQPQIIVSGQQHSPVLEQYADRLVQVSTDVDAKQASTVDLKLSVEHSLPPMNAGSSDDLAYIIYTSGSTGNPKGVSIHHRGIVRLVRNTNYVNIQPGHHIAQLANASFDAITFELWGALLNGACVHIMPQEIVLSPSLFGKWIKERNISFMFVTVTLFNKIVQQDPAAFEKLDTLLVGGEACHPKWMNEVIRYGKPLHLLNGYGPTESTTFALTHELHEWIPDEQYSVPIGRPITHSSVYVLDQQGRQMPINVAGELYIGGAGLASGYWRRDDLTAERFVADPFLPNERLYKTGDRVKWLPDGTIAYLGRLDHQVKLRGYRIELGEIEETVRRFAGIREATVQLRYSTAEQPFLAAYFTAGQPIVIKELHHYLKSLLPDYMIPAALIQTEAFYLTSNGKINTALLPDISEQHVDHMEYEAPQSEMEEVIADIWQEILGLPRISIHDSFFAIGGHSLLAIQVIAELEAVLEQPLSIKLLFEYPTVSELAVTLEKLWREGEPA